MDIKTLVIAAVVVFFATSLMMALVWRTRQTYPGFGYWTGAAFCRFLGVLLFFPREHLPTWTTVILANYLILVGVMLNNRGVLMFRGRSAQYGYGWEIAASLGFIAGFAYFTYLIPDVNARIILFSFLTSLFHFWTIWVLLTQRPAYFGSSDVIQAGALGVLIISNCMRMGHTWAFEPSVADFMQASAFQGVAILVSALMAMLITLSQIIMNAQRLEYDYRMTQEHLEVDINARKQAEAALRESEEKFRLAFDSANTGMCLVDLQGRLLQVNAKMCAIFGYSQTQLETMTVNDLTLPEDVAVSPRFIKGAVHGDADSAAFEKRYRHQQGHVISPLKL